MPKIYRSHIPDAHLVEESIYTFLFSTKDKFPSGSVIFIDATTGRKVTRGELKDLTLQAGYGMTRMGLKRGDTVMIFSPNSIGWPIALFGAISAGLRATLANTAYTASELAHQYTDSRASVIFLHPSLLSVVLQMFKDLNIDPQEARKRIVITAWAENVKPVPGFIKFEDLLGKGRLKAEERFSGKQVHETAFLCYSSGTTGKSKGVESTHHNVTSVLSMIDLSFPPVQWKKDVILGVLPMYHIYGIIHLAHLPIFWNIPCVVMSRFEPNEFCANIARYKATISFIVPPILVVLTVHPAPEKHDVSSLKILLSGAAPLGAPLVQSVKKRLTSLGAKVEITQGYGLTETSPTTHILALDRSADKMGSCGTLLPNLEARLIESDSDDPSKVVDAQIGQPGELWVRGPSVMKGYLNNELATRNAITPDKWFKTGDVAIIDSEGFYTIVDRVKELIKYKGFQVPPADLESLLLTHPKIIDVGVIGIDSVEQATELPRAYVVPRGGVESLKGEKAHAEFSKEIEKWIESRVAKHKYLRGGVIAIDAIPKSGTGKILRRELRERAKKELAEGSIRPKL